MIAGVRWLAEYAESEKVAFRIGRAGDLLVAEWLETLLLVARRDGTVVELTDAPGSDPRETNKIRRGSVPMLLRHLRGELAFHGAAVGTKGGAIVLLGRSGQGKSTLAAAMCALPDVVLLGDDATLVDARDDGYAVLGAELDHWLDAAARAALHLGDIDLDTKLPVRTANAGAEPQRLSCFVDLAFDDALSAPRIARLVGLEPLACLVPQVVRFVLDEPSAQRRELDDLLRLVTRVPVYRLERPRDLAQLALSASLCLQTRSLKQLGHNR